MERYIQLAQTRPKPPLVWLLFLKGVGHKRAVLGTTLLPNGKGHFGQRATFKAGHEYSGWTKPKWSVPFAVPTEISGILG